jgi:hypothetical protein
MTHRVDSQDHDDTDDDSLIHVASTPTPAPKPSRNVRKKDETKHETKSMIKAKQTTKVTKPMWTDDYVDALNHKALFAEIEDALVLKPTV